MGSQGKVGAKGKLFSLEWVAKQVYTVLFTVGIKFAINTIRSLRIDQ